MTRATQPRKNMTVDRRLRHAAIGLGTLLLALIPTVSALPDIGNHVDVPTAAGDSYVDQDGTNASAGSDLGVSTGMVPAPLPISAGASASYRASAGIDGVDASLSPSVSASQLSDGSSLDASASPSHASAHAQGPMGLFSAAIDWFQGLF